MFYCILKLNHCLKLYLLFVNNQIFKLNPHQMYAMASMLGKDIASCMYLQFCNK